jgi:transposase
MQMVRTDKWKLISGTPERTALTSTVSLYRSYVRALSGVVMTHWPEIALAKSRCAAVEQLVHATSRRTLPIYGAWFAKNFPKFPSYLRRAAIEFVLGQCSSFNTRYWSWQGGERLRRDARPPGYNPASGAHPVFYKGPSLRMGAAGKTVLLKARVGGDWAWIELPIKSRGTYRELPKAKELSPHVRVIGSQVLLCMPVRFSIPKLQAKGVPVLAVDVGINKTATCAIVQPDGTVTARVVFHPAADLDRRDRAMAQIRTKASRTMGPRGTKLTQGFCPVLYRRVKGLSLHVARSVARQIADFAAGHGVHVVVCENLKGFRPKAGAKRSPMKARFHGWMHRALIAQLRNNLMQIGGTLVEVFARGTSAWAYDGSGKVKRDKDNVSLATFANGRRYDADFNAAYNIAARYLALAYLPARGNTGGASPSRSRSGMASRTPIVLADLWKLSRLSGKAVSPDHSEPDAPTTVAAA